MLKSCRLMLLCVTLKDKNTGKLLQNRTRRHFDPFTGPVMRLIIHHQHFMQVIMHVLRHTPPPALLTQWEPLGASLSWRAHVNLTWTTSDNKTKAINLRWYWPGGRGTRTLSANAGKRRRFSACLWLGTRWRLWHADLWRLNRGGCHTGEWWRRAPIAEMGSRRVCVVLCEDQKGCENTHWAETTHSAASTLHTTAAWCHLPAFWRIKTDNIELKLGRLDYF